MDEKKIPTVIAQRSRDGKTVRFECSCGKTHTHGFDEEMLSERGSHRASHCDAVDDHGYFVKAKSPGKAVGNV